LGNKRAKEANMAKAGQEVQNPRQRDRIVFLQTARETGGRLLRLEMFAAPEGAAPPEHVHPRQEERFETVSGVLRARVGGEERPALNTETFFETMCGLARDGKLGENGAPPLLQTAIISSAYEIYLPRPPVALQKALFAFLVPVGKLVGYRASYPEYSGADALEKGGSGDGRRRVGVMIVVGTGILALVLLRLPRTSTFPNVGRLRAHVMS
jgi:hypothetical protein